MLTTLLIVLLLLALTGGALGFGRFGAVGLSPAGVIVLVLAVLLFMGRL
jgi:hypothetical protein